MPFLNQRHYKVHCKKMAGYFNKDSLLYNSENVYVYHGSSFHEVISLTVLIILGY